MLHSQSQPTPDPAERQLGRHQLQESEQRDAQHEAKLPLYDPAPERPVEQGAPEYLARRGADGKLPWSFKRGHHRADLNKEQVDQHRQERGE